MLSRRLQHHAELLSSGVSLRVLRLLIEGGLSSPVSQVQRFGADVLAQIRDSRQTLNLSKSTKTAQFQNRTTTMREKSMLHAQDASCYGLMQK